MPTNSCAFMVCVASAEPTVPCARPFGSTSSFMPLLAALRVAGPCAGNPCLLRFSSTNAICGSPLQDYDVKYVVRYGSILGSRVHKIGQEGSNTDSRVEGCIMFAMCPHESALLKKLILSKLFELRAWLGFGARTAMEDGSKLEVAPQIRVQN